ncbi:DNA polymerase III subunit gamma/tau [Bacillota bacterium LX-D]|nr:DNA polymerase III subunit gamma/tau [Bacillota bacterium LX-D]
MSYIALYRQWRPMDFKQVVGQEHVVQTLQHALELQRISHAYLFCGPRGTGKTSMAKILAKAINCLDNQNGEPCNQCASCQRINQGQALDILEIDAASNRGIDEIRDLRENIKLSPVESRYKVYIIDEVHMLTMEAFNALLKTLEEPPAHVVFILATTEPHKIPLTILSRCQRFDFHRIPLEQIAKRLKEITEFHQVEADESALFLIAKTASGGMRDAVSLLDQCMSMGTAKIITEQVAQIAGLVSDEYLLELVDAMAAGHTAKCLTMLYEALKTGKEVRQLIADLLLHLRNLLLLQLGQGVEDLIIVANETLPRLKKQSSSFGKDKLLAMIKVLAAAENEIKWSTQGQILLEISLLKAIEVLPEENKDEVLVPKKKAASTSTSAKTVAPKAKAISPTFPLPEVPGAEETKESIAQDSTSNLSLEKVTAKWQEILDALRKVKIVAYAFFIEGKPIEIRAGKLVLQYREEHKFHKERSEQPENKKVMEQVIEQVLGCKIALEFQLKTNQSAEQKNDPKEDELYLKACEIFGGDIVELE